MAGCSGAISVPKPVSIPGRAQAQAEQSGCEQGQGRGHRRGVGREVVDAVPSSAQLLVDAHRRKGRVGDQADESGDIAVRQLVGPLDDAVEDEIDALAAVIEVGIDVAPQEMTGAANVKVSAVLYR